MKIDSSSVLMDIIKSRRTIRKYKDKQIPSKLINNIIEAGRWAPSAHNLQPWEFTVITSGKLIKSIQAIMLKKEKELLAGFNIVMKETAKCLNTAKVVILVYSDGSVKNKFVRFDEPYTTIGNLYEIQSVCFAISNMMLYTHAAGIGCAFLGIASFCDKEINVLLNQNRNLVALLSLGFPNESGLTSRRKSILEIAEFL